MVKLGQWTFDEVVTDPTGYQMPIKWRILSTTEFVLEHPWLPNLTLSAEDVIPEYFKNLTKPSHKEKYVPETILVKVLTQRKVLSE